MDNLSKKYPGIPADKTKDVESCVSDLMKDEKLKSKYPDAKTRKSHAIAICHSSIMGHKKGGEDMKTPVSINFYGNYWDELVDKDVKIEVKKVENPEGKEVKKETMKTEDIKKEEVKEEVKPEVKEEVKPEVKEEVKPEVKEEVKPEVKEEVKPEVKEEKVEKKSAEPEQAGEVSDLLKSVIEKLDKVLKKEESAPAEGAAPEKGEAPKEEKGEAPKEEKKEEGASPEGAEKVEKSDDLNKVLLEKFDSFSAELKKISGEVAKIGEIDERLKKVEEQPAPSKVASPVVVGKEDIKKKDFSKEDEQRLAEIDKELGNLENLKKTNLETYQAEKSWNKAWKLQDEKNTILTK